MTNINHHQAQALGKTSVTRDTVYVMTPCKHHVPALPRFLVTAGNTRERIDQVRDWGNIFTGNTGFDIACALAQHGPVDLFTSNQQHLARLRAVQTTPHPITGFSFTTHAHLRALLEAQMLAEQYHAVFMSAAVSDYQPAGVYEVIDRQPGSDDGTETWRVRHVQAGKVKSFYQRIAIMGEPTEKLVDLFRTQWGFRGLLFKFKLEVGLTDEQLLEVARKSRVSSGADYLIANTLAMVQGDQPGAYIVSETGAERVARHALAGRLAQLAMAAG